MHLAKGLEFPAVAVMACDDEILPLQARIEAITDEADLEEVLTPNGICCMSRAPAPAIICMFQGSSRGPNFSLIFRRPAAGQTVPAGNLDRVQSLCSVRTGPENSLLQSRGRADLIRIMYIMEPRAGSGPCPEARSELGLQLQHLLRQAIDLQAEHENGRFVDNPVQDHGQAKSAFFTGPSGRSM